MSTALNMAQDTPAPSVAQDIDEALRSTGMLAAVRVTTWTGEANDKVAVEKLKSASNAEGDVGKFHKRLLANAGDRHKAVMQAIGAIRALHYTLTLPWASGEGQRGPRLLPNALLFRYMKELGAAKAVAEAAIQTFVDHYDDDKARAIRALGDLANAHDYPSADEVQRRFSIQFDLQPIPTGAGFAGLPPAMIDILGKRLRDRQEEQLKGAVAHTWAEARERVAHLHERLAEEGRKFQRTTVDQVAALPELLRAFNLQADPRLDEVAGLIAALGAPDADRLREDNALRVKIHAQLGAIIAKLDEWGV